MGRNSNKVPICFPPVMEFFNYPPLVRLDILTTFSLSNMIEYLTRVLHPSNRFSTQITHGLQPPEEAINNLALSANEEMLDEFLNRNINFNLMCYLTAQNKRTKALNNALTGNFSNFDDFSLVINLSSPPSSPVENASPSTTREMPRMQSNFEAQFSTNSLPILSNGSLSMTPYDDPFEFSSSLSFPDEFHPNASTVSEMSWNGSESSISSSFMFVSSGEDSRPGTPTNAQNISENQQRFSYAEMLSKGLNPVDYSDSRKMSHHFPPLSSKNLYSLQFTSKTKHLHSSMLGRLSRSQKLESNYHSFLSPPSSLNLPSWSSLDKKDKKKEFKVTNLPLWKKYREIGMPNRDNYHELLKIWYSHPRVSEGSSNWFFDVWNENILQDQITSVLPKMVISISP